MTKRQIRLGLSMRYLGYHNAAWRHSDVLAGGAFDFRHFLRRAQAAERGCFDMVFFVDCIGVRADDGLPGSLSRSNRTEGDSRVVLGQGGFIAGYNGQSEPRP